MDDYYASSSTHPRPGKRSPRVVLMPYGVRVSGPGEQHIPWAMVYAISETEIDGVARVVLRTADGARILLPAPRKGRLLTGDLDYVGGLEELWRWHAHYRAR